MAANIEIGKEAPVEFFREVNQVVAGTGSIQIPVSRSDSVNQTGSNEPAGTIKWDDNNIYVNTSAGWKSASLA